MDSRSISLLAVGQHLRHLLFKRALPSATVDKACCSYYEYLYNMRNSSATISHLVLHFTTYTSKGRSKLGEQLNSNAEAANIGCELIDYVEKRCKTEPVKTEPQGIDSVNKMLDSTPVQDVKEESSHLSDSWKRMEASASKVKKSRWKRFKEKLATRNRPTTSVTIWNKPQQAMDTDVSVEGCSAPSTVDPTTLRPDGAKRIVPSSATPQVRAEEKALLEAGYAAYARIRSGKFDPSDLDVVRKANCLPLRIPVCREMEIVKQPTQGAVTTIPRFTKKFAAVRAHGPSFTPPSKPKDVVPVKHRPSRKTIKRQKKKPPLRPRKHRSSSPVSTKDYAF